MAEWMAGSIEDKDNSVKLELEVARLSLAISHFPLSIQMGFCRRLDIVNLSPSFDKKY